MTTTTTPKTAPTMIEVATTTTIEVATTTTIKVATTTTIEVATTTTASECDGKAVGGVWLQRGGGRCLGGGPCPGVY